MSKARVQETPADVDDHFQQADSATVKHEETTNPEEAMRKKIDAEVAKYHRMPKKYIGFTIKYRCFWLVLNLISLSSQGVMAWLGVRVLNNEHEQQSVVY